MELWACSLMLFISIHSCDLHPLIRPNNGLRACRKNVSLTALEVLPGGGWDNLRNLDMGRVMNFSYSQCQTTEDGAYLIPDEVFVIPRKTSGVESNSEIISTWLEQKSSTSQSINADVSLFSVLNAKFSVENQRTKTHQVRESSVTARVQVRNLLYTVKAYPDFTLDSRFAQQAVEIADAIENNQTRRAMYLSERLILDYGTHVITSVDAGAALVQEDFLKASYVSNSESAQASITASAGVNFFNKVKFDIGTKDTQGTSETRAYEGNMTYSITQSYGGALFYPGITLQKWQESTLNNLVAIDRDGLPLHYFLSSAVFPNLPVPTVHKLAKTVQQAAKQYYKINTHPGCLAPGSRNFNFQANVDDSSCEGPATNLSFGGVYQECTKLTADADPICKAHGQKNPDTGSYSCRQPFSAVRLRSETREEGYSQYECHRRCHSCWIFAKCCKNVCGDSYYVRRARIDTYWCSSNQQTPEFSGYLFGGLYGPSLQNPLTKSSSCPPNFFPQKLLSNDLVVCLSNDYETASRFSVPFGGFFSCESNNPLAGDHPRCPPQFSQHLAAISDGCQVLFCVKSGIFTGGQLLPIRLPPFTRPPLMNMMATNTVAVMTEGDKAWVRVGDTKMWKLTKAEEINKISGMFDGSSSELTGGEKLGVAVGVLALTALVIVGVALMVRRRRRVSGYRGNMGYEELDGERQVQTGGVTPTQEQPEVESESPTQTLLT